MPWYAKPYRERGFFGALGGFPHDVRLHTMAIIFAGLFDRYPGFRLVIGHMGESMPLQLYRFDWMQGNSDGMPGLRGGRPAVKLKETVSHYFRHNIWITTSGVAWEPAIRFCMEQLGPERVLYAMDYPYQQSSDEVAAYDDGLNLTQDDADADNPARVRLYEDAHDADRVAGETAASPGMRIRLSRGYLNYVVAVLWVLMLLRSSHFSRRRAARVNRKGSSLRHAARLHVPLGVRIFYGALGRRFVARDVHRRTSSPRRWSLERDDRRLRPPC